LQVAVPLDRRHQLSVVAAQAQAVGIADEKRGAQVFYTLRTPCVRAWPSCVEGVLAADARRARLVVG